MVARRIGFYKKPVRVFLADDVMQVPHRQERTAITTVRRVILRPQWRNFVYSSLITINTVAVRTNTTDNQHTNKISNRHVFSQHSSASYAQVLLPSASVYTSFFCLEISLHQPKTACLSVSDMSHEYHVSLLAVHFLQFLSLRCLFLLGEVRRKLVYFVAVDEV